MVQYQHVLHLLIHGLGINCFGLSSGVAIRISGIPIPKSEILTPRLGDAPHVVVITAVGRSHEGGTDAKGARKCLLHAEHGILNLSGGERGEISMGPGMLSDHVPGIVSVLDTLDGLGVVDAVVVVAIEEEGAFCACCCELIGDLLEILVGT